MKIIGKILLLLIKCVLLILLLPVLLLNLLITFVGNILATLLGILGFIAVVAAFLGPLMGLMEWSEIWIMLLPAFIFGILPSLLVIFGSGLLSMIQNNILVFIFGQKSSEIVYSEADCGDYTQREIPLSSEDIPSEQLIKLKELLDMNIITKEEFELKKQKLLDL